MLMRSLGIATVTTAMLLGGDVIAQTRQERSPAPEVRTDRSAELARWVDDRVIGIAFFDLTKADLGAFVGQVAEAAGRVDEAPGQPKAAFVKMRDEMNKAKEVVDQWVADFKAAGGDEVYFVISPKPALIVPVRKDADADKLAELLNKLELEGSKATRRDEYLIVGNPLRGLPLKEPTKADQVKAAQAAVDDVTPVMTAVLTPSDMHKIALGEILAKIGKDTGNEVPQNLNLKVVWVGMGASNAPNADIRLVVQATGNLAAQQLAALANAALNHLSQQGQLGSLVEVLRELKFIANEDRAELTIRAATTKKIVQGLVMPLVKARENAKLMKAMNQGRQVLVAVHAYAADHTDALPPSMDDLKKDYLADMDLTPPSGRAWKYIHNVKRLTEIEDPSTYVLLHEEYKTWPAEGMIVGFADGHIEVIQDEGRFKALIKGR